MITENQMIDSVTTVKLVEETLTKELLVQETSQLILIHLHGVPQRRSKRKMHQMPAQDLSPLLNTLVIHQEENHLDHFGEKILITKQNVSNKLKSFKNEKNWLSYI